MITPPIRVEGHTQGAFSGLREALADNFSRRGEVGASVAAYHHGKLVATLWGGTASESPVTPWKETTVAVLASPSKLLAAISLLLLVDAGDVDLNAPLTQYWPEMTGEGRDAVLVRHVLSHSSGLITLDHDPVTFEGLATWSPIIKALERAVPEWQPGRAHGYHAFTYGHLVGEIVKRVSGRSLRSFFADRIAKPYNLNTYLGLPSDKSGLFSPSVPSQSESILSGGDNPGTNRLLLALRDTKSLSHRASIGSINHSAMAVPESRRAQVGNPSYDGTSDAVSLARLFAVLIGGVDEQPRLLSHQMIKLMAAPATSGGCLCLLQDITWGLGVMVADGPLFPASLGLTHAFGCSGASGSFVFADPAASLSMAYVPNRGSSVVGEIDPRAEALVSATYAAVRKHHP